jgi:hypothetical protein
VGTVNRSIRVGVALFVAGAWSSATPTGQPAVAAEPVSATLDISWTRPGVPGVMTPPAKVRVGDTVTLELTPIGFSQSQCEMFLVHLGTSAGMGVAQTAEVSVNGQGYCRPWTFTMPPAQPGTIAIHATASGDDATGADDAYAPPIDADIVLEAGGTRRPYASTYPSASWATIDMVGTDTPAMTAPLVFAHPPGATQRCGFSVSGDWGTSMSVSVLDGGCEDWHVTLPDLRPAELREAGYTMPWEASVSIDGGTVDPDTGAFLSGYGQAHFVSFAPGSGADTLITNLPAVTWSDAGNPRWLLTGSTVHLRPEVHGIDGSGVCRLGYNGPITPEDGIELLVPLEGGTCGAASFAATQPGVYQIGLQLDLSGEPGPAASYRLDVVDPMPAPSLELDTPVAGETFDVTSSVTDGVPSEYEFSLSGTTAAISADDGTRDETGLTAATTATSFCSSGRLDFLQVQRTARGTCTAPTAGTYRLTVRFEDVTGATRSTTKSITVADPAAGVVDIVGHKFEADIRWLYTTGITSGCTPDRFCPDGLVTRGQMATFLSRALDLPPTSRDYFIDDETSKHESSINRLRAAGITFGCAPDRFCPTGVVTRAQMASFLVRAFDLSTTSTDYFTDDDANRHEPNINALRAARITYGCSSTRYCPDGAVTRGQMAAFLHRAFR